MVKFSKIVNSVNVKNVNTLILKIIFLWFIFLSLNTNIPLNAEQIANSSIDQKKDVDNFQQKNFKSKQDLESSINEEIDKEGNERKIISEKTILLKSIKFSGNKKFPEEKLLAYFDNLLNTDVTFSN